MAMMNAIMKTSLMIIQTQPGDFRPPADHPKAKEVQAWHTPIGGGAGNPVAYVPNMLFFGIRMTSGARGGG